MRTNKEKYDALYEILEDEFGRFIRMVLPVIPEKYYAIEINYRLHKEGYFIAERTTFHVDYKYGFPRLKKPSRIDIAKLREFIENSHEFTSENIFLHWKRGNWSGADSLSKIGVPNGWLAWTAAELKQKLTQLIDKYSPKEGYIACAYCRKQRKPEEIQYDTIMSPNWKDHGYKSPPRPYCKDNHCASYDRMAHEG